MCICRPGKIACMYFARAEIKVFIYPCMYYHYSCRLSISYINGTLIMTGEVTFFVSNFFYLLLTPVLNMLLTLNLNLIVSLSVD